jgi:hypothetical protein
MTTIKVLVTQENGVWVAIGLEHFMVGQGTSPDEALRDLEEQFEMKVAFDNSHSQVPFALVLPAPEKYWQLFEKARWQSQTSASPYEGELRMAV